MRESARTNDVIVAVKLVIIVVFIAAAAPFVSSTHWVTAGNPQGRFIPPNIAPGEYGVSGLVRGAAVVFFAYIGFDAVSTAAQEAKNPQRDMPIGILGSLAICTLLYVAVGFVLTGIVPYDKLNVPDPIAVGIDAMGHGVPLAAHQARRDPRPDFGDPGDAPRTAADFLFDGAGRAAAADRRAGPSALPHALRHHDRHRHRR